MKYYVGTSGYDYNHWRGRFYPKDLAKKKWFNHYSAEFDTVEMNNTFYRWPSQKIVSSWESRAPQGFKYCIKAPRTITHVKRLKGVGGKVKQLYALTRGLRRHIGCHLFQLPPSFKKTGENLSRVCDFLKTLDSRKDNAVEFRHKSWWDDETIKLCKENKIGFVTVAGLDMPEDFVDSDPLYVRFHGEHYDTCFPGKQLSVYASKIRKSKAKKKYVYFNNDEKAYAIENAKTIRGML